MSNAEFQVSREAPGWWVWSLRADGRVSRLGADALAPSVERVLASLEHCRGSDGEIEGCRVTWLLSLSEEHYSLYCSDQGSDRLIFVLHPSAAVTWRGSIDSAQRERWRSELQSAQRTA